MALDNITYGTDYIATHSGTENATEVHLERITPGAGILGVWDDSAEGVSATGLVSGFSVSCAMRGRIVLGAKCATSADLFYSGFLVFKNSVGTIVGVSATISPAFKVLDDGGSPAKKYAAIQCFGNECGASTVEFYLTALPSGATAIDLYMAAL